MTRRRWWPPFAIAAVVLAGLAAAVVGVARHGFLADDTPWGWVRGGDPKGAAVDLATWDPDRVAR